jgi:hypothetical protein
MKIVKAIVMVVAVGGLSVTADARAHAAGPTGSVSPSWCQGVPASPPPPGFERHPGDWASVREMCGAHMYDRGCRSLCMLAEELWSRKKAGRLNQPNTAPSPSSQPQGPFPLPGGASGYILPAQPAPTSAMPGTSDDSLAAVLPLGPRWMIKGAIIAMNKKRGPEDAHSSASDTFV